MFVSKSFIVTVVLLSLISGLREDSGRSLRVVTEVTEVTEVTWDSEDSPRYRVTETRLSLGVST